MSNCILCEVNITKMNDSKEHIIPNALGGNSIVKGFICNQCNNNTGKDWDVKLISQLNPLCLLLGIRRGRGDVKSQSFKTLSGDEYYLRANGSMIPFKPVYKKTPIPNGFNYSFIARDIKEAEGFLNGIKKEFPHFDIEGVKEKIKFEETYLLDDPLHIKINFGGVKEGMSLIKTLLAFSYSKGIDPHLNKNAISYLKEEIGPCYGYYYDSKDVIIERSFDKPMHCLAIQGNPKKRKIIGYLEYFGVMRVVALLSDNYDGEEFKYSQWLSPEDWSIGEFDFNLDFGSNEIAAIYDYKKYDESVYLKVLSDFFDYTQKKGEEREMSRVSEDLAIKLIEGLNKLEGEISRQDFSKVFNEVYSASKIQKYILSRVNNGRGRSSK